MSEHDFEPIRGLPGQPPPGETIQWQGAPDWRVLAQQAFHIRAVAVYFAAMLLWRTSGALIGGEAPAAAVQAALLVAPIGLFCLGMLAFFAWLNSVTTVYTITSKRVVMRFGAALPKAINIPFSVIDSAAIKPLANGAGDLSLTLKAPNKIGFLHLWPHVRPWRLAAPEPTFRGLPNARAVAAVLAAAIQEQIPIDIARSEETFRETKPVAGRATPRALAA
jgi:hypothetical protein